MVSARCVARCGGSGSFALLCCFRIKLDFETNLRDSQAQQAVMQFSSEND